VRLLAAMALGALLVALAYQIPVTHAVDVGGFDSAYVQGFYDPERALPGTQRPELGGSDGGARWTRERSFLIFPQAGLPAQITLRLRGWRPNGAPPHVTVLLNGTRELGRFEAGADWHDYTFTIDSGLLKPNDVMIEIRSDTGQLAPGDPRRVGVLLDRATYHAGPAPIVPYPPQLLYGALAAGMLWLLIDQDERRMTNDERRAIFRPSSFVLRPWLLWIVSVIVLSVGFLLLYRAQMPYPYPLLRLLPALDGALAALLALRYGPALTRRAPVLLDALAVTGVGAWLAALLVVAQRHVTLSVPSMEKDFRVFASRSAHLAGSFPAGTNNPALDGVFRADGFYNLGYPLLLWLARPFTSDNPFLAARLIAALSGALLLGAAWWLARRTLGRGPALLALLTLALSPLVVEYALYVGTDMPFAALCTLAVALLVPTANAKLQIADKEPGQSAILRLGGSRARRGIGQVDNLQAAIMVIAAGVAAGTAFLIRHPGLLLVPFGYLTIWLQRDKGAEAGMPWGRQRLFYALRTTHYAWLLFTIAFLVTISPQLYVNLRDTGAPLYNQQAKNVWQAVFGDGDWGRWGEANNSIGLGQVIAHDPQRFVVNWWTNLRGFLGTGGEDTREFGQAVQLRLLGFPANWLAIAGLLGWLVNEGKRQKAKGKSAEPQTFYLLPFTLLLIWIALYVATISIGLPLQGRFLLPLVPIYAVAAAWTVTQLGHQKEIATQITEKYEIKPISVASVISVANTMLPAPLLAGIVLLVLLWGGFTTGADYVVRPQPNAVTPGQPADTLDAARLVLATLQPGDRLILRIASGDEAGLALGKYSAIAHLVVPAPASDDPAALRATGARYLLWSTTLGPAPSVGEQIGTAGIYTLYRIK
jgi:4-amino-4-deoxy-L-arabinose transferase-like glycosyltransferase